jgi:hypothetical protein
VNRLEGAAAFECCGVRIDVTPFDDAVDDLCASAGRGGRAVHLCNAYTLALASRDAELTAALNHGDRNYPDGIPLVWIARVLGFSNMARRVYGPDLMAATIDRGRERGVRHFLLGATPEVLDALRSHIDLEWPGAVVTGSHAPPFGAFSEDAESAMFDAIRHGRPDLVWVGLGTPNRIPSSLVIEPEHQPPWSQWVLPSTSWPGTSAKPRSGSATTGSSGPTGSRPSRSVLALPRACRAVARALRRDHQPGRRHRRDRDG